MYVTYIWDVHVERGLPGKGISGRNTEKGGGEIMMTMAHYMYVLNSFNEYTNKKLMHMCV